MIPMTPLFSFLKSLWSWRRRPPSRPYAPEPLAAVADVEVRQPGSVEPGVPEPDRPATPDGHAADFGEPAAEPALAAAARGEERGSPAVSPSETAAAEVEDADEEDDAGETEEGEDGDLDDTAGPDPFISLQAAPLERLAPDQVAARRAEARALALNGEHRIFLTDAAGPGTVAEALNLLVEEGRVEAEFQEDGERPPHILYRPVG